MFKYIKGYAKKYRVYDCGKIERLDKNDCYVKLRFQHDKDGYEKVAPLSPAMRILYGISSIDSEEK